MTIKRASSGFRGLVAVSILALLMGACDKGLTSLNKNPNDPENVPVANILPNAIRSGVNQLMGVGWQLRLTGLWPQLYAEIQYPDEDRYIVRPSAIQAYWDGLYVNSLEDFQRIITKSGAAGGNPNYAAIATIMKSWEFASASDVWGDMPYTDALEGDSTGNFKPAYTPQQDIFNDILTKLAGVSSMMSSDPLDAVDASSDLIYGGDLSKWVKFANSLRLRYAMQIVNADPTKAEQEFTAAWSDPGGVIMSNDDNAEFRYLPSYPNDNPWHEDWRSRDDYAMSATLIDTLKSLNDPRLTYYAEPTDSGPTYQGMPNGIPNDAPKLKAVSRIGNYWRANPNGTFVIMGASEVMFLAAEAAERGWIAGNPATYYQDAIRLDMTKYKATAGSYTPYASDADIATYLAQPRIQYAGGQAGLDQIHLQMWISFFGNANEAYATWRRSGIPQLAIAANNKQDAIPVRLPYADLEQSLNHDNWQAAVTAQGLTDGFSTPVWWDKPPTP